MYLCIVFVSVSVKQRVDLLEAAKLPICDVRCQVKCSQAGQVESNMKYRASGIKYNCTFKVESNTKYRDKYNHMQIQGQVQEDKYRNLNRIQMSGVSVIKYQACIVSTFARRQIM